MLSYHSIDQQTVMMLYKYYNGHDNVMIIKRTDIYTKTDPLSSVAGVLMHR